MHTHANTETHTHTHTKAPVKTAPLDWRARRHATGLYTLLPSLYLSINSNKKAVALEKDNRLLFAHCVTKIGSKVLIHSAGGCTQTPQKIALCTGQHMESLDGVAQ